MFYLYFLAAFLLHHLQLLLEHLQEILEQVAFLHFQLHWICKKVFKKTRNKKKKHNKIARSKLNSIESKISKALMDNEISH